MSPLVAFAELRSLARKQAEGKKRAAARITSGQDLIMPNIKSTSCL